MKKLSVVAILFTLLLFSSCGRIIRPSQQTSTPPAQASSSRAPDLSPSAGSANSDLKLIEKPFGSYYIPPDWFESKELSRDDYFFYLKDGTSIDKPTSNISVNEGSNNYGADDYQSFAHAIDQQLKSQGMDDVVNYSGGGSFTEKGIPLITMNIETEDSLTTQYYIVGDHRFVMVQLTDFYDENIPDVEDAALAIVNSFKWVD